MTHPQAERFREQALGCEHLGSAMYAGLLRRLADDLDAGGPTAVVLTGHERDPGPAGLALRLLGSVHRLVLAGLAPELAPYYPSVGGTWSDDGPDAVLGFLAARGEEVRPLLDQAPQTNEVGRATALVGGLLRLTARWPLPVRLFEMGASAGLNLRADRFRFTGPAGAWGDATSPVVLEDGWTGAPLPVDAPLRIVERGGCDLSPVDVTTEDGRLALTSYVWPDQSARHARLAGAVALARTDPVTVERADAASYVARLTPAPGHLTVLWHSVMWQYVPVEQQERVTARLEELGRDATEDAPVAHLYAEPLRRSPGEDHRFWICAHTWPGTGERVFLGRMAAHGVPAVWE
jgi:hypothetical protein